MKADFKNKLIPRGNGLNSEGLSLADSVTADNALTLADHAHSNLLDIISQDDFGRSHLSLTDNEKALTVLVIDDDEQVTEILTIMLERLGYDVSQAREGFQAIASFKAIKNDIAFVVIDLDLPDISGASVCMQIKNIRPEVKAILSTGDRYQLDNKLLDTAGFDAILDKPFSMQSLKTAVHSIEDSADPQGGTGNLLRKV